MKAKNLQKILIALTLTTLTTISSTIAATNDYRIYEYSVDRKSWDEFIVSFSIQNMITGNSNVKVDDYKIDMYGEDGTILKSFKNKSEFIVDDKNLGSGEKLLFKLTAKVNGDILSSDRTIYASQKSVTIDNDVNLPIENHISIGEVKMACKLMRTKFTDNTKWETIGTFNDVAVSLFISNGNNKDYVEVPLNKKSTYFDLAQYKYFDDFQSQMERDLRNSNTAVIKYYFQFVWDRNVYVVEGGSKNINIKNKNDVAIVKSYTTDIQKLVTTNSYSLPGIISASAE